MQKRSEFGLIESIKSRFPLLKGNIIGIGDDAAVFEKEYLITTDALIDGVHFLSGKVNFSELGYKSAAVNISDIAAMGGYPLYALLTLGIPKNMEDSKLEQFISGIAEIRREFPFDLIGGDTVSSSEFTVSMTFIGKPYRKPLLRSGAKVHDTIYVSGKLGDSAIGLELILNRIPLQLADPDYFLRRHNLPSPRVYLMEYLVKNHRIHSCIDVSDGLLQDLGHIADESKTGFALNSESIPLSAGKIGDAFKQKPATFLNYALSGGEDYELIFTTSELIDCVDLFQKTGVQVTAIGRIVENGRTVLIDDKIVPVSELKQGFQHF